MIDFKIKNNVGGVVSANALVSVEHGDDKTVNYKANKGYELKAVVVDGVSKDIKVYPTSYEFKNITSNHSIEIEYTKVKVIPLPDTGSNEIYMAVATLLGSITLLAIRGLRRG